MEINLVSIWIFLTIVLTWVWASIWQLQLTRAAMDTLWKNPKIWKALLIQTTVWITLIESIVIFWLMVSFTMLKNIDTLDYITSITAWLSIWIVGFIVWLWEWKLMATSIESLNRNPENKNQVLMFMILFAALLESIAIFALLVSLSLLK